MKNGEAKCKLKSSSTYHDCIVELEWISSDSGSLDSGTLVVLNPDGATTLVSALFYYFVVRKISSKNKIEI